MAPAAGRWRTQPRLRDLIQQRLVGPLGPRRAEALELVALGDPLEPRCWTRLVPLGGHRALEARGLLDAASGEVGSRDPAQPPPLRRGRAGPAAPLRRTRLCRALADAAEARRRRSPAATPCGWRSGGSTAAAAGGPRRSWPPPGPPCAAEDYELSVRLARSPGTGGGSVDAALILGDALDFSGRCREAEQLLETAYALATTDRQRTSWPCGGPRRSSGPWPRPIGPTRP